MRNFILTVLMTLFMTACASVEPYAPQKPLPPNEDMPVPKEECVLLNKGLASWYGYELAGNKTANGEKFNPEGITAAHRTLPFGSIVKVVMDNGRGNPDGVYVRINDRGPFVKGRIIDLSWGAAKKLGMKDTKPVHIYRCS
jgi:rare lipoprotein A